MNAIHQLLTDHIDIWTATDAEKRSGRGRSSGNVASVYGIKKLRELILELAVRGKLVPQDPNDEPASELLKRIQAEKSKLIAESKIKKANLLPPITVDERPFVLPKGWEWVYLPDVSDYKVGKTPSTKSSVYWTNSGDGFNWVSIADLNHDGTVFETSKQITDKAVSEVFRSDPAPAGTILMSFKLTLGKISILDKPAFHNEAIISIYPSQGIFKDFLFKVLPARAMAGNSKSAIKGNTLNSESIAALMIPLPPLTEQHRIVAKVDELMALCDQLESQHNNAAEAYEKLVSHLLGTLTQSQSAEDFSVNWQRIAAHFDTLFTTEASIDALKQTLLQLAVMGKLVPQDPNDEPASELLKRIQAEKAKLIAEGKSRKNKTLVEIIEPESILNLPPQWSKTSVENVSECLDGIRVPVNKENRDQCHGDVPYYGANGQVGWINDYLFDEDLVLVVEDETFIGRTKPFSYIVKGKSWVNNHAHVLRPLGTISAEYLNLCLQYYDFIPLTSGTTARRKLTQKGLMNANFWLAPLKEQQRIVAKVDELMVLCGALKARINEAQRIQTHLADTIVNQALA